MSTALRSTVALALMTGLAACSSKQGESEKLLTARTAVERAQSQVKAGGAAQADLERAQASLSQAEAGRKKDRPQEEIDNFAYSAEQSATAALNRQEAAQLQNAGAVQSEEQKRDATMALHKAETAETEAHRVQQLAQQSAAER